VAKRLKGPRSGGRHTTGDPPDVWRGWESGKLTNGGVAERAPNNRPSHIAGWSDCRVSELPAYSLAGV